MMSIRAIRLRRGVPHLRSDDLKIMFPALIGPGKVRCGAAIPPGWAHMCFIILRAIQDHNDICRALRLKGSPIIVNQIKEKFGELRFYITGGYSFKHLGQIRWPQYWRMARAFEHLTRKHWSLKPLRRLSSRIAMAALRFSERRTRKRYPDHSHPALLLSAHILSANRIREAISIFSEYSGIICQETGTTKGLTRTRSWVRTISSELAPDGLGNEAISFAVLNPFSEEAHNRFA